MSYRTQTSRNEFRQFASELSKREQQRVAVAKQHEREEFLALPTIVAAIEAFKAGKPDAGLKAMRYRPVADETEQSAEADVRLAADVFYTNEGSLLTKKGRQILTRYMDYQDSLEYRDAFTFWQCYQRCVQLGLLDGHITEPKPAAVIPEVDPSLESQRIDSGVFGSRERSKYEANKLRKAVIAEREPVWRSALQKLVDRGYFTTEVEQDQLYNYVLQRGRTFNEQTIHDCAVRLLPECGTESEQRAIAMSRTANTMKSDDWANHWGFRRSDSRSHGGTRRIEGTGFGF